MTYSQTRLRDLIMSIDVGRVSTYLCINLPSVLWRCWLGGRKGIRPVKTEWRGAGVVICLERGADLHMPSWYHCHSLSLAPVKSRLVLPFWYRPTRVVLEKGSLNVCVCVCVCVYCTYIVLYIVSKHVSKPDKWCPFKRVIQLGMFDCCTFVVE